MSVFGIGTTLAVFHSLGNVPVARDELKSFARLGAMLYSCCSCRYVISVLYRIGIILSTMIDSHN